MIPAFQTQRLHVAPWGGLRGTAEARATFHEDLLPLLTPQVLEHLPPALQDTSRGAEVWADERDAVSDVFAVHEGPNLVGLMMLFVPQNKDRVHLGYMLAEQAWGQGYASELVTGLCATWPQSRPVTLIGGVARENPASARVLVKAGFARLGDTFAQGVSYFARPVP